MTEKEIRRWMLEEVAADRWWLSVDGKLEDKPMTLSEAADRILGEQGKNAELLHDTQFHAKDRPWVTLDPKSVLTPERRKAVRPRRRRKLGRSTYLQLFIVLLIGLGFALIYLFRSGQEYFHTKKKTDSLDAVFAKIDQGGYHATSFEPELKATVAISGRLVYLVNKTSKTWGTVTVTLTGKRSGYQVVLTNPIRSNETIQIPLREFQKDGETYPYQESLPGGIKVEVPGYQPLEEKFEPVTGAVAR